QPSICSKAFMTELDRHKNMVRGFPWILIGDFNVVLNLEDSFSGSPSLNYAISEFKECVNKIELCLNNGYLGYLIVIVFNNDESDSEVKETIVAESIPATNPKGASTPSNDVFNV
nr:RNA-directed DNA polymerase, eukaryota, reverse transcriptase zinc-binding domain protein [Tanacetum cinerariifolium]